MFELVDGYVAFPREAEIPRGSDEWWFVHLSKKLGKRLPHVHTQQQWIDGNPPLPYPDKQGEGFDRLQRIARLNPAEIILNARVHRMQPRAFRTAVDSSANGDDVVNRIMKESDAAAVFEQALRWALGLGNGALAVDYREPADPSSGVLFTAEHPSQVIVEPDPRDPARSIAALKVYRDEAADEDVAVLWRPGYQRIARHTGPTILPRATASSWALHPVNWQIDLRLYPMPVDEVPVYELGDGRSCFEKHIPDMLRINHTILQRMILIALQAFRQRAVKGVPRTDPETGEEIDYEAIFETGPGELWILPGTADFWESGQADITPVLKSVQDDLKNLSAVSNTPLYMLAPDAANESATGADLKREGIVFEIESRIRQVDGKFISAMHAALMLADEEARAERAQIRTVWANPRRSSLTERAEAGRTAKEAGVPWRERMELFLELTPEQIAEAEGHRSEDALLAVVAGSEDVTDG
jgi:hypothetical protein